jgi:hypothetical protein
MNVNSNQTKIWKLLFALLKKKEFALLIKEKKKRTINLAQMIIDMSLYGVAYSNSQYDI